VTPEGNSLAIKIYKTSILIFKDRERYIEGEFRFRKGYSKHNPRKMVKIWAEKEYRNLKRIVQSGIPCPEAIMVKSNILIMHFLGKDMTPYPRLKNTELDTETLSSLYLELIGMIRTLYQDCRLIHADLSEYNLLYGDDKLWMIDVSQSLEHDHPHALDFLRRDIVCANMYFKKNKVKTFSVKSIFDFVTDPNFSKDQYKEKLADLIEQNKDWDPKNESDEVFANIHIPRTLQEIGLKQLESDIKKNDNDSLVYGKITGLANSKKAQGWVNDDGEVVKEDEEEEKYSGEDSDGSEKSESEGSDSDQKD
jgi:RIO kinase 1